VREFRIDLGIGNIAAGRHIEIVQLETGLELRGDMAGVVLTAKGEGIGLTEGKAGENGDAVIALWPLMA
jgi:hypothetical protein